MTGHPKIHNNSVSLVDIPKECPKSGINSLQDKNQGNLKLWAHKAVFLVWPGYAEYSRSRNSDRILLIQRPQNIDFFFFLAKQLSFSRKIRQPYIRVAGLKATNGLQSRCLHIPASSQWLK